MLSLEEIKELTPGTKVTLEYIEMESDETITVPAVVSEVTQDSITLYKGDEDTPTILFFAGLEVDPDDWHLYKA